MYSLTKLYDYKTKTLQFMRSLKFLYEFTSQIILLWPLLFHNDSTTIPDLTWEYTEILC